MRGWTLPSRWTNIPLNDISNIVQGADNMVNAVEDEDEIIAPTEGSSGNKRNHLILYHIIVLIFKC